MLLIISIVSMFTALFCYTQGVWSEKRVGRLSNNHLIFFWTGLVFDTLGTTLMGKIAGVFTLNVHGVTGAAAIILMMGHAIWATTALLMKQEKVLRSFHRFSLAVWALWLVPFLSGMVLAMMRPH
jgi:uncharacterized repeat protein (TIGR03987 family)